MGVNLFITIDTEEDNWGQYTSADYTFNNIESIPLIQGIFDRYGAIPIYLISYPVVENERARAILLNIFDDGRCEIGAHCHPWNTPPFQEEANIRNTMLCNLPYEIILRKIETLHEAIVNRFKMLPICFRAGRFGFGPLVARCIHELEYKIDTSVTPFTDWTELEGPDFSNADVFSYRFDPSSILSKNGNGCLLEVPATIGFFQNNLKLCSRILKWILRRPLSPFHLVGILDRFGILNRRWLSPEVSCNHDMITLTKNLIQLGYVDLNMTFHSTSLLPGKSPFVRNENDLNRFLHNVEAYLQFSQDIGLRFLPLAKALETIDGRK